jgi:hypothetical protein
MMARLAATLFPQQELLARRLAVAQPEEALHRRPALRLAVPAPLPEARREQRAAGTLRFRERVQAAAAAEPAPPE